MGPALADYRADNEGAAPRTWFTCAAEYLQGISITSPVPRHTVEIRFSGSQGRATVIYTPLQHSADGLMELFHFSRGQGAGAPFRMNFGLPQRLIHINIAQTRHAVLIQQEGFDHAGLSLKLMLQYLDRESVLKRFRPQLVQAPACFAGKADTTELAGVVKDELMPIGHGDHHLVMFPWFAFSRDIVEFSRHAEVDQEVLSVIE